MSEDYSRTMSIDLSRAKEGNNFPVVLSTESPVERPFGTEILVHESNENVDLSRAPIPVLIQHNSQSLNIGIVDSLRVVGRKLRGVMRLSTNDQVKPIIQDIADGILRNVSIGYRILKTMEEPGGIVRVIKFLPLELSLVSVPADPEAGIFRSLRMNTENLEHDNLDDDKKLSRSQRRAMNRENSDFDSHSDPVTEERKRVAELKALGREYDLPELAEKLIANGGDNEDFRVGALQAYRNRPSPQSIGYDSSCYDNRNDFHNYSLVNAVRMLTDPSAMAKGGFEREVSDDYLVRGHGNKTAGNALFIPYEALPMQKRAITVSADSELSPSEPMPQAFVDVLRDESFVLNKSTVWNDLHGDAVVPRKVSGATGSWHNLDHVDDISESEPTFDDLTLTPKSIGTITTISHKTMIQSSLDVEALIRQDLSDAIAQGIDATAINGTGAANDPTGIINQTGIGADTFPNGTNPTWADIVDMEQALANAKALKGLLAYAASSDLLSALKTTEKATNTAEFIFQNGKMNGYDVIWSGNIPSKNIIFANWQDVIVGLWGGFMITADPYTHFAKGSTRIRAIADIDVQLRHPTSVYVLSEAP